MDREGIFAGLFQVLLKTASCAEAEEILTTFAEGVNALDVPVRLRVLASHHSSEGEVIDLRTSEGSFGRFDILFREPSGREKAIWLPILAETAGLLSQILENRHCRPKAKLLKQSEERLRAILEACPNPIAGCDPGGRIRYINPAFTRVFGWQAEDLATEHFLFVPEDQAETTERLLRRLNEQQGTVTFETVRFTKKGGRLNVLASASVIRKADDDSAGVVVILTDITDKKRLENQLRQFYKTEAESMLTIGVTQELNTQLGIIASNVDLAIDGVPEWNPARTNMQEVRLAALRAKDAVQRWHGYSRRAAPRKEQLKLHAVIREVLPLLRAAIPPTIEIQTDLPENAGTIMADAAQIQQLLLHLGTNAAQAMEGQAGLLAVSLAEIEVDEDIAVRYPDLKLGNYLRLSVADNGPGMTAEVKAHIFNPHFTTKEAGRGAGMGLAVAQGIVKNHLGVISIYSEVGHGTTVRVLFPFANPRESRYPLGGVQLPTGFEKILFVDDESTLVEMGRNMLSRLGYSVVTQTDPEEALVMLRADPSQVDLVITDMSMPQMDGTELASEIRSRYPHIPIILCTGISEKINGKALCQLGLSAYLEKPVDKRELAAAVRKALDAR